MTTLQVDTLSFAFQPQVAAQKYDQWHHYLQVWNIPGRNQKAMDVVAAEPVQNPTVAWLIEAKDYRIVSNPAQPSKIGDLATNVAMKVTIP